LLELLEHSGNVYDRGLAPWGDVQGTAIGKFRNTDFADCNFLQSCASFFWDSHKRKLKNRRHPQRKRASPL
jgi:hypothetical protein